MNISYQKHKEQSEKHERLGTRQVGTFSSRYHIAWCFQAHDHDAVGNNAAEPNSKTGIVKSS